MSRVLYRKQWGFSLIELMTVVAIVGILARIAYPSYQRSIEKSRRAEAKGNLNIIGQGLERCFTQFGTYNNAGCVLPTVTWRYYTVVNTISATTYSLTATTTGSQVTDTRCVTFTLTNTGARTATGTDFTKCW